MKHEDLYWLGGKAVMLGLFPLLMTGSAFAQDDPCAGEIKAGEVGLPYGEHCLIADDDGAPVQSVIVKRVEGLDGVESVQGVVLIRTIDGWVIGADKFVAKDDVENAEVGDDGYLIVDAGK